MADTPENGSIIYLEEAQDMLKAGAPTEEILPMVLKLSIYMVQRMNSDAAKYEKQRTEDSEKIETLRKHDVLQKTIESPKIAIPVWVFTIAMIIPESRSLLFGLLKNLLGIK